MLSSKFSDLAGGFVTDMWRGVVIQQQNPASAEIVVRYTVELEVSFLYGCHIIVRINGGSIWYDVLKQESF